MVLQDAIDHIEGNFTCELGAPWRWADLLMSKPYQLLEFTNDVLSLRKPEDLEHRLVARLISNVDRLKKDAGFYDNRLKPKLFWRWQDKVRISKVAGYPDTIAARFYIDGNPPYIHSNPSNPKGRPTVGQMRLVA